MICTQCEGTGIVPASTTYKPGSDWNGSERRRQARAISNQEIQFQEVEAALYRSCPQCEGSGKLHPNLLSLQK